MDKHGILINSGFRVSTNKAIDTRFVLTKSDLVKIKPGTGDEFDLNRFPDYYFAIVVDELTADGQLYVLNRNWFSSEGDRSGDSNIGYFHRVDYDFIKKHPSINGVELKGNIKGEDLNLQSKMIAAEGITISDTLDSEGKQCKQIALKVDGKSIIFDASGRLTAVIAVGKGLSISADSEGNAITNVNVNGSTVLINDLNQLEVPIDGASIKLNSEGKLYASSVPLVDGIATTASNSKSASKVDVNVDNETIKVNGLNNLEVSLGRSIIKDVNGLEANVDAKTIFINSEGKLCSNSYLDEKTIITNSEGMFATQIGGWQEKTSIKSLGSYPGSVSKWSPKVTVVPASTIVIPRGGDEVICKTIISAWPTVEKEESFILKEYDTYLIGSAAHEHTYIDAIKIYKDKSAIELTFDETTLPGNEHFRTSIFADMPIFHKIDGRYIPVDDSTITLTSNGELRALARALVEGQAISIDSEAKINVKIDDASIKLNSEGKLFAVAEPLIDGHATEVMYTPEGKETVNVKHDGSLLLDSEGKLKVKLHADEATIVTDADGMIGVPIDHIVLYINSEGKITARQEAVAAGEAIKIDPTTHEISVKFDHKSLHFNSEGDLSVSFDEKTIVSGSGETKTAIGGWKEVTKLHPFVHFGPDTVFPATLERVCDLPTELPEVGEAAICSGTWDGNPFNEVLGAWYEDGDWIKCDSPTTGDWIDSVKIKKDLSIAFITFEISKVLAAGSYVEATVKSDSNLYHKVDGKYLPIDNVSIQLDSANNMYVSLIGGEAIEVAADKRTLNVKRDNRTIVLGADGKLNVPIDDLTITTDSEGKLIAVSAPLQDGVGTKVRYVGSAASIDVQFDNKTLVLNSEGKFIVPIDEETLVIDSEGLLKATFQKSVAEAPIEVNSEGVIKLNYKDGLAVDSEGKLKVDYDNLTILLDSEGKLMAMPEPLKNGKATEIKYEGRAEVVNVLVDDKTIILNSEGNLIVPIDNASLALDSEGTIRVSYLSETEILSILV